MKTITIFNDLCIGVFASLWAIIQTFVHLWWILIGSYEYACPIKFDAPSRFLKDVSCNDALSIALRNLLYEPALNENTTLFLNTTEEIMAANMNARFKLPKFSESTSDVLMLVYVILDGVWLVTSVSLLLASCCKFKEKSSLYFYMPWVIIGTVIIGFDVYCSVYFGLNIPENWTILEWFENLGILDKRLPKIFSKFKDTQPENNSGIGFRAPVFLMTLFTSRIFFIWFINVLTVFAIFRIAQKVSAEKEMNNRGNHRHHHRRGSRESSANNTFHNTFEERVRNWQDFYGTLRENGSNGMKKKRTSITYLETSSNGTEIRCIDLSSYDSFRKGRVRIASENESSTDSETMNSTFKYGVPEESSVTNYGTSGSVSQSALKSSIRQGSTSGLATKSDRHIAIAGTSADSRLDESISRF